MYTSNFAKSKRHKDKKLVSIARWSPKGFKGIERKDLAPKVSTLNRWKNSRQTEEDWEIYTKDYYDTVLSKIDIEKLVNEIGMEAVFLCYEKETSKCHRFLLKDFLEKNLNIEIKEI